MFGLGHVRRVASVTTGLSKLGLDTPKTSPSASGSENKVAASAGVASKQAAKAATPPNSAASAAAKPQSPTGHSAYKPGFAYADSPKAGGDWFETGDDIFAFDEALKPKPGK